MSEERRAAPRPTPVAHGIDGAPTTDPPAPVVDPTEGRDAQDASLEVGPTTPARRRTRSPLRIPDDEVSHPQAANPEALASARADRRSGLRAEIRSEVRFPERRIDPPFGSEGAPLKPMRIITINPEPSPAAAPQAAVSRPPLLPREEGDGAGKPRPSSEPAREGPRARSAPSGSELAARRSLPSEDLIPIEAVAPVPAESMGEGHDPRPRASDVQSLSGAADGAARASASAASAATVTTAQVEPEGEDVRFDDDVPTPPVRPPSAHSSVDPVLPPAPPVPSIEVSAVRQPSDHDGERRSDPGAEVDPADLVAVFDSPSASKVATSLPPVRPPQASRPSAAAAPRSPVPPASPALSGAPVAQAPVAVGALPPQSAASPSAPATPIPGRKPPPSPPPLKPPPKPPLVIVPPHVGMLGPQSTEGSGSRRKGRLWWEDLFNDDYLRTCEKLSDEQIGREVDFIAESLGIERGGTVLDLACGTGRHAIELARRGYEVVGFDLSLAMLARAGDEAQGRGAKLNFLQGDMREMTFDEQFDGVFCWNTSFGYFEEEKNAQVVDRMHRALKSGGLLLLDVVNRDFLIRQSPSLAWFEGDGCVCMDEMAVDFITSRMKVKRTILLDDGRSREIEYSVRIYGLHELGKVLHDHGFKVCEVSGRIATPGVFFGSESPRAIILAEKRDKK